MVDESPKPCYDSQTLTERWFSMYSQRQSKRPLSFLMNSIGKIRYPPCWLIFGALRVKFPDIAPTLNCAILVGQIRLLIYYQQCTANQSKWRISDFIYFSTMHRCWTRNERLLWFDNLHVLRENLQNVNVIHQGMVMPASPELMHGGRDCSYC